MLKKVFIANRGEIAARIGRAAKEIGISTVSLLKEGDCPPQYLASYIDEWIEVEALGSQVYLDNERMLAYAQAAGCDSLHPGYGFLSENARFAQATTDAGLIWVGPNAEAIKLMGDKSTARELALQCKVPVLSGYDDSMAIPLISFLFW